MNRIYCAVLTIGPRTYAACCARAGLFAFRSYTNCDIPPIPPSPKTIAPTPNNFKKSRLDTLSVNYSRYLLRGNILLQ